MPFIIREATPADIAALAQFHVATFNEPHMGVRNPPTYVVRERQWREALQAASAWHTAEPTRGRRMRSTQVTLFVWTVLWSVPCRAQAPATATGLVKRAIQAQGGARQVARMRIMRIKVAGTMTLAGQPNLPITMEDIWQMPHQYKSTSSFELKGQRITQTQTINGATGWIQVNGQTQDLAPAALSEMQEQRHGEDFDRLAFLQDKTLQLSLLPDSVVSGKPAHAILIRSKGHRDVRLYFDRANGLLVKRAHPISDGTPGKTILQEVVYSNYEDVNGLKYPKHLDGSRDGRQFVTAKVTEVTFFTKLDAGVFADPSKSASP